MNTLLKVTNEELVNELKEKVNKTEEILKEIQNREENKTMDRDIDSILEMLFND